MSDVSFADRYAEIGLAPGPDIVSARAAPAERILENISNDKICAMVSAYLELSPADLEWLRAEFVQEDTSFSLVNNAREIRLLSAAILDQLVDRGNDETVLMIASASLGGKRLPAEFAWLVEKALAALEAKAIKDRLPRNIETRIVPTVTSKLAEEITSIGDNDWSNWRSVLTKIRGEATNSAKTTANQTQAALKELNRQVRLQREENQMLWWVVGQYGRTIAKPFARMSVAQATVIAAVDLGELTTVSRLGPAAAPAMIERMIGLIEQPKATSTATLAATIDAIDRADLKACKIYADRLPPQIALVTTAIELAHTLGPGSWHVRFSELTGASAEFEFEPIELATLLYREQLLGQLL